MHGAKCSASLALVWWLVALQVGAEQINLNGADSNIPFDSSEGRKLLVSESTSLESYFMLAQHFVTQDTLGYCGHASATMALNAVRSKRSSIPSDKRYPGYGYYTQEGWVGQSCVSNALGAFSRGGMGIESLEEALNCNAYATAVSVNESQPTAAVVKSIRKAMDESKVVIVNVFRRELEEKGWTLDVNRPLGAYNADKNGRTRFLFLDVSRYKYEPVWVKEEVLVAAMAYRDPISRESYVDKSVDVTLLTYACRRGYLVVSTSGFGGYQVKGERSYETSPEAVLA